MFGPTKRRPTVALLESLDVAFGDWVANSVLGAGGRPGRFPARQSFGTIVGSEHKSAERSCCSRAFGTIYIGAVWHSNGDSRADARQRRGIGSNAGRAACSRAAANTRADAAHRQCRHGHTAARSIAVEHVRFGRHCRASRHGRPRHCLRHHLDGVAGKDPGTLGRAVENASRPSRTSQGNISGGGCARSRKSQRGRRVRGGGVSRIAAFRDCAWPFSTCPRCRARASRTTRISR
jgi:hypothetical protein